MAEFITSGATQWATDCLLDHFKEAEREPHRATSVVDFWKLCEEHGMTVVVVKKGEYYE